MKKIFIALLILTSVSSIAHAKKGGKNGNDQRYSIDNNTRLTLSK